MTEITQICNNLEQAVNAIKDYYELSDLNRKRIKCIIGQQQLIVTIDNNWEKKLEQKFSQQQINTFFGGYDKTNQWDFDGKKIYHTKLEGSFSDSELDDIRKMLRDVGVPISYLKYEKKIPISHVHESPLAPITSEPKKNYKIPDGYAIDDNELDEMFAEETNVEEKGKITCLIQGGHHRHFNIGKGKIKFHADRTISLVNPDPSLLNAVNKGVLIDTKKTPEETIYHFKPI